LFIELIEHFVGRLVHVSTMADDYYRFVERAHILRVRTRAAYRLGDKVSVQVIKVDNGTAAGRSWIDRRYRSRA
jgi:ribonuclease R